MNLLQYFHAHYQDNVIAGFINSLVVTLPSLLVLLWRIEKHHKHQIREIKKLKDATNTKKPS